MSYKPSSFKFSTRKSADEEPGPGRRSVTSFDDSRDSHASIVEEPGVTEEHAQREGVCPFKPAKSSKTNSTNILQTGQIGTENDAAHVQKNIRADIKGLYENMAEECERMEAFVIEAEDKVATREEISFLMTRQLTDVTNLTRAHADELKELEETYQKTLAARADRKKSKAAQRLAMRETKRRDMTIRLQESAASASRRNRESLVEKRKAFDALIEHLESFHEKKRKQLLATQERRIQHEKMLYECQTRHFPEELRNALMKKFQVRQNYQAVLNKKLFEQTLELQQLETRHAKEKFDLETRSFDEVSSQSIQHTLKTGEMAEVQQSEQNNEKEKYLARKDARKVSKLEAAHLLEMKVMAKEHRISVRQLKVQYEQKLGAKANKSGISTPGSNTGHSRNGSNRGSTTGSINSITSAATGTASFGLKSMETSHFEEDDFDEVSESGAEETKADLLVEKIKQKHAVLNKDWAALKKKDVNDLALSIEAKFAELEENHYRQIQDMTNQHATDISELKAIQEREIEMEQSVHDAEMNMLIERRILNSVLETVSDGIINIDPIGTIVRFNEAASLMFGWQPEEVISKNIKILMPEQYAKDHDEYLRNYMTTGVKKVIGTGRRAFGMKKDGSTFPIHLALSEVKEQDQHLFTGIIRDLTEEVRQEEETRLKEHKKQEELETLVRQLNISKAKSNDLLSQILPPSVSTQLLEGKTVAPQSYDSATIFFLDVVGFTTICAGISPMETVGMLNSIYTVFDEVIQQYDAYKVETIGDSYMVVSGIPNPNGQRHASEIATMALHIMSQVYKFVIPQKPDVKLQVRIGINTGPAVAGVVGSKMPRYCLFGDSVNTASRMESSGEAMKIQVSESCYQMLNKNKSGFHFTPRGEIQVKGKGKMTTYWLTGKDGFPYELPPQ